MKLQISKYNLQLSLKATKRKNTIKITAIGNKFTIDSSDGKRYKFKRFPKLFANRNFLLLSLQAAQIKIYEMKLMRIAKE